MRTDRIVLITGAAGGIGAALVARFLANGDKVIATSARQERLDALQAQTGASLALAAIAADLASPDDVQQVADFARTKFGRVDVLINCAGHFPIMPFEEMSVEDWKHVIDINLTGFFLMERAIVPLMRERGWGRIINYGSGSVFDGTASHAHYTAAKAGVVGLTRCSARALGQYGITVNVLVPGLTVTDTVRDSFAEGILAAQRARRAIQRDEVAEDLVGPTFFLASPDSDFITGQTLNVDGGNFMI